MDIDKAVSRRGILVAGAGVAGVAVLAACSGGSEETSASSAASQPASSTPPSSTAPATESSAAPADPPSSTAAGTDSGSDDTALVTLDDVQVGSSKAVKLANGKPAIVTRTGTATAVCFSAICTHTGCTVKPKTGQFDCPCHESMFDAKTGKVLGGPAPSPLPKIAVTVVDGKVTEAG